MIQNWLSLNKIIIYNKITSKKKNFISLFKNKEIVLFYDNNLGSKKDFKDFINLIKKIAKKINRIKIYEEPTEESIKKIIKKKIKYNLVVSIGGGSTIDLAKIFTLKLNHYSLNQNSEYLISQINNLVKNVDHISIPTTCGTGSEVTPYSVIKINNKKFTFKDEKLVPDIVILNEKFIKYLPKKIKIPIIIDALSHAYEALTSKIANFEILSVTSIPVIKGIIKELLSSKQNNLNLLIYSLMAGISISNAGTSVVHAFGQSLASFIKIPHSLSICLFFQRVINNSDDKLLNKINKELGFNFQKKINRIYKKYNLNSSVFNIKGNEVYKKNLFNLCYGNVINLRMKSVKKYPTKFNNIKIQTILKSVILQ